MTSQASYRASLKINNNAADETCAMCHEPLPRDIVVVIHHDDARNGPALSHERCWLSREGVR